jgi:hypothetical protein
MVPPPLHVPVSVSVPAPVATQPVLSLVIPPESELAFKFGDVEVSGSSPSFPAGEVLSNGLSAPQNGSNGHATSPTGSRSSETSASGTSIPAPGLGTSFPSRPTVTVVPSKSSAATSIPIAVSPKGVTAAVNLGEKVKPDVAKAVSSRKKKDRQQRQQQQLLSEGHGEKSSEGVVAPVAQPSGEKAVTGANLAGPGASRSGLQRMQSGVHTAVYAPVKNSSARQDDLKLTDKKPAGKISSLGIYLSSHAVP